MRGWRDYRGLLTLVLAVVCMGTARCGAQVRLDQQTSATIVIAEAASKTEQFAAQELQRYLQAILHVRYEIETDTQNPEGVAVVVGHTRLNPECKGRFDLALNGPGRDSYLIRVDDKCVYLCGGADRATLYSVYEFLEAQGCRWYMPGPVGEILPDLDRIELAAGEQCFVPDFIQRSIDVRAIGDWDTEQVIDWAVKNRLNWVFAARDHFVRKTLPRKKWDVWEKRGGQLNWQWICHNLSQIMPSETFFDEHPEYYSLYKGQRIPLSSKGMAGGNLCTTHPDVIRICAEFAENWFAENPTGQVVPLWPADGLAKWCECERCAPLGGINFAPGTDGSMSRRMVTFADQVARIVGGKYPDRLILCPAYACYIEPVPDITLPENVLVQYCLHGCYAHGVGTCPKNAKHRERLQQWAANAAGPKGVWEYFLLGDHYSNTDVVTPAILPVSYRARDTIRFLHETGYTFYFTQASPKYWRHNPLPFYITARMIWDVDLDFESLWERFFRDMYGPAAEPLQAFYELIEQTVYDSQWHPQIYSDVAAPSVQIYRPEVVEKLASYLAQAQILLQSKEQRDRVMLVNEAFQFVQGNIETQSLAGLDENASWRIERNQDHYVINPDGREIAAGRMAEMINNAKDMGSYNAEFERTLFRAAKRKEPLVVLENDRLTLAVLPGIGGRIVRMIDKQSGWNYMDEHVDSCALDTIGQRYFTYGGYEEYIGKAFAGAGWEQKYDYFQTQTENSRTVHLALRTDDVLLRREVILPKGGEPLVVICSTLFNCSAEKKKLSLRAHPAMTLGPAAQDHIVFMKDSSGGIVRSTVGQENGVMTTQPHGAWAIANGDGRGVANFFDPDQATCYICKTGPDKFNMELFGVEQDVASGGSLELVHAYLLVDNDPAEFESVLGTQTLQDLVGDLLPSGLRRVTAWEGATDFAAGKVGRCGRFGGNERLTYSSAYVKADAGTLLLWVKPDAAPSASENQFLLGVGDNNPEWWAWVVGDGKLTFLARNGRKPYTGVGEYYHHLSTPVPDWQAGQWRHVAFVWKNGGRDAGLVQIYLDGELVEERRNATLGQRFTTQQLDVGHSRINARQGFRGNLDELILSNRPLDAAEIRAIYDAGRADDPPTLAQDTLLYLGFEDTNLGVSQTVDDCGCNASFFNGTHLFHKSL